MELALKSYHGPRKILQITGTAAQVLQVLKAVCRDLGEETSVVEVL